MCEFCKEPYGRMITDGLFEQCRIECLKEFSSNRSRYTLSVNNSAYAEINFCPMCGRNLSLED